MQCEAAKTRHLVARKSESSIFFAVSNYERLAVPSPELAGDRCLFVFACVVCRVPGHAMCVNVLASTHMPIPNPKKQVVCR